MLFGGLLPPGAVSVEAVEATGVRKAAAVGGGTYAVIFEDWKHSEPGLGYRDAAGAFVHRPMPAEYPHQPVTDAEEPCPVCGAIQYEEYFPTEDWRGGRGRKGSDSFVPSPLIFCRRCGHQEQAGGIMRFGQPDSADEDAAAREARMARIRAEQAVQRWYANKMTLMGCRTRRVPRQRCEALLRGLLDDRCRFGAPVRPAKLLSQGSAPTGYG